MTLAPRVPNEECRLISYPRRANSVRYTNRREWTSTAKALKPIYTVATHAAALERPADLGLWETRYPAIVRLWANSRAEFVHFLSFDPTGRGVEPHHHRNRESQRTVQPGHTSPRSFPDQAGRHELPISGRDVFGPDLMGRLRWMNRQKAVLDASTLAFDGRTMNSG